MIPLMLKGVRMKVMHTCSIDGTDLKFFISDRIIQITVFIGNSNCFFKGNICCKLPQICS